MLEIHTDEKEVLGKFIHPELFGLVLEEINLTKPVTIDIVRQLFHRVSSLYHWMAASTQSQ